MIYHHSIIGYLPSTLQTWDHQIQILKSEDYSWYKPDFLSKEGNLVKCIVLYSFVLCVLVLICTIKASISNLMSAISFSFVSNDWLSSDPDLMAADTDQGKLAEEHKWTMPGGWQTFVRT